MNIDTFLMILSVSVPLPVPSPLPDAAAAPLVPIRRVTPLPPVLSLDAARR